MCILKVPLNNIRIWRTNSQKWHRFDKNLPISKIIEEVLRHACLTEWFSVTEIPLLYQEFPFCHRKYLFVNCISFMQHDFLPVTQNYLWKKFPSCNKIFVPVTGIFLPLTGISYLLQEFHHRIFKMLRFPFGIFLFFFPSLTFIQGVPKKRRIWKLGLFLF